MEHLMYKNFKLRVRNKLLNILFDLHFQPRHWVHTVKYSLEDTGMPSQRLLDLTKKAYEFTMENNLESIKSSRMKEGINHIELEQISFFPGAHYRILNGIVRSLNPKRVVEIGTWTGVSSLAILDGALSEEFKLTTFDIVPWNTINHTALIQDDFGVHFEQKLADLSNREVFQEHKDVFQEAELIFIDGPKDGIFEYKLVEYFKELNFDNNPIIFFDDINQIEMLNLWHDIEKPKFDITSLGQFTGTGLIDWIKS